MIAALGAIVIALLATSNGQVKARHAASAASAPRPQAALPAHHSSVNLHALAARDATDVKSVLRYTPFIKAGTTHKRDIALTFDDGPSPYTFKVIDVLTRMQVHATFFIVGQHLPEFPGGLRDEVQHGFPVGDHTENHLGLRGVGAATQYGQIHIAAVKAQRLGAPMPRLFRPPYGVYDSETISTLRSLGMLMVLWSVDTGDWRRPGVPAIVKEALSGATPGGIILMHDGGGDRSQTVAALPAIIRGLRRRHYRLVTVPQLLAADPPPRHQHLP
ncbi:MAG: polysaccharide deacetylase family protein [Solirubrobacterales bacterium]|nr:polysaccharide deacetylase family protein [Solirubrobacterales bacterium]